MNLYDLIKERIKNYSNIEYLENNPYDERITYITDEEEIKRNKIKEYRLWYAGDGDELLNFYTNKQIWGNAKEPIFNRNKSNYFWGISSLESDIKRVHSSIPNIIISTLINTIGQPNLTSKDEKSLDILREIIDKNKFYSIIKHKQLPLTLVDGWGAYKINFDKTFSNNPIIQYYEAENVDFIYKNNVLIGIIYKDYYRYKNKNYVLIETRRINNEGSIIEYELFKLEENNEVIKADLGVIPELKNKKALIIKGYYKVLGVPCKFYYDSMNKNYGRSVYTGKIDLFDDLDQILSQASQTVRVSTPIEYFPIDLLERDAEGNPKMPKVYNRQYIAKQGQPNGDGNMDEKIQTTQPNLNLEKYSNEAKSKLDLILAGILSPSTIGMDLKKNDNAEAQREKEKTTINTRNNIIEEETIILKELFNLLLMIQEYIDTGKITQYEYNIGIKFNEFANPSFENEINVLGKAWSDGQLSTKQYVELLWGNKLSLQEKEEEISWLDRNRDKDNLNILELENYENR